jgi:hypothetical protein
MERLKENVIEWITGDDTIACTFSQRKYITKVLKLRDKQPNLVSNFVQNRDGSIFCHLPLKALKLYIKTSVYEGVDENDEDCEYDESYESDE